MVSCTLNPSKFQHVKAPFRNLFQCFEISPNQASKEREPGITSLPLQVLSGGQIHSTNTSRPQKREEKSFYWGGAYKMLRMSSYGASWFHNSFGYAKSSFAHKKNVFFKWKTSSILSKYVQHNERNMPQVKIIYQTEWQLNPTTEVGGRALQLPANQNQNKVNKLFS